MLPVEHVYSIANRGTVVSGLLERGKLKKGDDVEFVGYGKRIKTKISGLEMFHQTLEEAIAGDQLGALVRNVKRDELCRGMVMVPPATAVPRDHVEAQVYIMTKEEGGRDRPFTSYVQLQLFSKTWDCTAHVRVPGDTMVMPGTHAKLVLKLIKPMFLEYGQRFTIRDGKITLGTGIVTHVHYPLTTESRNEMLEGRRGRERRAAQKAGSKK